MYQSGLNASLNPIKRIVVRGKAWDLLVLALVALAFSPEMARHWHNLTTWRSGEDTSVLMRIKAILGRFVASPLCPE